LFVGHGELASQRRETAGDLAQTTFEQGTGHGSRV
jgi:hypothetical protein